MSVVVGRGAYAPPRSRRLASAGAVAATILLLGLGAFLVGRSLAPTSPPADPIVRIGEIPVGVEHSPAGALASADNYVAVSYDSVERNPALDALLISTVYAPAIRASAMTGAAAVRAQNAAAMRLWAQGGDNLSLIGARRLDYYHGTDAQVTSWNADIFWGPGRPPKQAWVLTQTSLRWTGSRWLVTATTTLPVAGPVPAITPQANAGNDSADAFGADLAGFVAPSYGAAG